MGVVENLLALGCPARTDDTKQVVVIRGPYHKNEAAGYRPNGDEAILIFGMSPIEDLEIVGPGEKILSLFERDAMFPPVREVLGLIPYNPHLRQCRPLVELRQWLSSPEFERASATTLVAPKFSSTEELARMTFGE